MQVTLQYGRQPAAFEVAGDALVNVPRTAATPLTDLTQAMRDALENPFELPALRRCVTPDDRVVVVVDERLPRLSELLVPLLEYLVEVGISASSITLLCAPPSTRQPWLDDLPESLEEVVCEVHDPDNDKKISYLATSDSGCRLYFNRSLVDADQVIVLSGCRYDPFLGRGGGSGMIYPTFSDAKTRQAASRQPSLDVPDGKPWPLQRDAEEAAWLLGSPFFVQVIEGPGDEITQIVTGLVNATAPAQQSQDRHWRRAVPRSADTIVIGVGGDPARHRFVDLADALASAVRVLKPNGRIALLCEAELEPSDALQVLRRAEEPEDALTAIADNDVVAARAAWQWATVAQQAHVFLLSRTAPELVEELFAVPLTSINEVQRLIDAGQSCLIVGDGDKALLVPEF